MLDIQQNSEPLSFDKVWLALMETRKMIDLQSKESDRLFQEMRQELDLRSKESERKFQESRQLFDKNAVEAQKEMKDLRQHIGGLHNKFGSFTEGLLQPSIKKLMKERFGITNIAINLENSIGDKEIEIDVLASSNGDKNEVFIIEVKSNLKSEAIEQVLKKMKDLTFFFPEHKGKKIFGMIAAVQYTKEMVNRVRKEGIYFASVDMDTLILEIPKNFVPKFILN